MSGELIVPVPIGALISLVEEDSGSDEESVICRVCDNSIPIRLQRYQAHLDQWYYSNIIIVLKILFL
jgi:hypothetical protein